MLDTQKHPFITPPANPNIRQLMDRLKKAMNYDSGKLEGDDEMRRILQEAAEWIECCEKAH